MYRQHFSANAFADWILRNSTLVSWNLHDSHDFYSAIFIEICSFWYKTFDWVAMRRMAHCLLHQFPMDDFMHFYLWVGFFFFLITQFDAVFSSKIPAFNKFMFHFMWQHSFFSGEFILTIWLKSISIALHWSNYFPILFVLQLNRCLCFVLLVNSVPHFPNSVQLFHGCWCPHRIQLVEHKFSAQLV